MLITKHFPIHIFIITIFVRFYVFSYCCQTVTEPALSIKVEINT